MAESPRQSEDTIRSAEIVEQIDCNPGTIRNQRQSLRALQLTEGVPGPKGSYSPTGTAYEALEIQQMDDPASVSLKHEGEDIEGVIV